MINRTPTIAIETKIAENTKNFTDLLFDYLSNLTEYTITTLDDFMINVNNTTHRVEFNYTLRTFFKNDRDMNFDEDKACKEIEREIRKIDNHIYIYDSYFLVEYNDFYKKNNISEHRFSFSTRSKSYAFILMTYIQTLAKIAQKNATILLTTEKVRNKIKTYLTLFNSANERKKYIDYASKYIVRYKCEIVRYKCEIDSKYETQSNYLFTAQIKHDEIASKLIDYQLLSIVIYQKLRETFEKLFNAINFDYTQKVYRNRKKYYDNLYFKFTADTKYYTKLVKKFKEITRETIREMLIKTFLDNL